LRLAGTNEAGFRSRHERLTVAFLSFDMRRATIA
jgi:hypothetical protein